VLYFVQMPKFTKDDFRKAAPRWKLVSHLEKAIAEFDDPWTFTYEPKVGDLAWHPSSDCTPPPSALYESAYRRLNNLPKEGRTFSRKNGFVGHFWHQFLQHILVAKLGFAEPTAIEATGIKVWGFDPDLEPTAFHYATGKADVAPCSIPKHGDYVVDFKTMQSSQFRQNGIPEHFREKYMCQINIYMDWFGLDNGLIVCVNKDTPHDMKEFEYRRNDGLVEAIYDKWLFVGDCLLHNDPPNDIDDEQFRLPLPPDA
jgi:hypothetical protein